MRFIVELPDQKEIYEEGNRELIRNSLMPWFGENIQVMIDDRPEAMDFVKKIRHCHGLPTCVVVEFNTTPPIYFHSEKPNEVNPFRLPNLREGS